MFHVAIQRSKCRGKMRLGLSWMLDYKRPFWDAWNSTADSMRTDEVKFRDFLRHFDDILTSK